MLQSDKVLQSTIASMKELESRCNTTAEQGDMLATAMDELQHRLAVMQKAILHPQPGGSRAADGAHADGLVATLRSSRRETRGNSPGRAQSVL